MTSTADVQVVAVDTSVLIHLIQVGQLALLSVLDGFRFVIPGEVKAELRRPESQAPVDGALAAAYLTVEDSTEIAEIQLLEHLVKDARVGRGEAACLTLATTRDWWMATDDEGRRFVREAERRIGKERILSTPDLILLAVRRGLIPVEEADGFPEVWRANDYFVAFGSFSEFLA